MILPDAGLGAAIDVVAPLFLAHRRFVLTTHANPDGDGLGSQIALASWLRDTGRDARIINHSPTPAVYRFLDPDGIITLYDPRRDAASLAAAEVIVVMDTNHPDRLRSMRQEVVASRAVKICIDHHLEPDPFARYYLIDEDATSTGEIVYHLLMRLHGPTLTPVIASGLYCAIMTDTGSFRYPRVDREIHEIVARLIDCGADPVTVYADVYERWSGGRIHLLGETLANLRTEYSGRLAYVSITRDMLRRTGTTEEDTDNFTTYPMSVDGVLVGILFLELDGGLKISFRSKGDIPINELARQFGGNGHKNAAGARIDDGGLDAVRARVITAAKQYLPSQGGA
jgi:phosphoesterase RecJ-like protein